MTYRRLETREGDRFYREAGAGEPIVFLHCSSRSSGAWVPVMNQLGRDYRVLTSASIRPCRTASGTSAAPTSSGE